MSARTLFAKVWDAHVVDVLGPGIDLLHIDRHMMHETTCILPPVSPCCTHMKKI